MTEVGYTKTIKPVRDWSQRIWRLMFTQQVEIARGSVDRFETSGLLFRQGTIELQDNTTTLADGALAAFPAGVIVGFRVTTDKAATASAGFYGWIEDAD